MDVSKMIHNSTKWARNSDQGRREEYLNRLSDTPIALDSPKDPKGLVSVKSKGPNTEINVSELPDPDSAFMDKDDADDIPSGLHTLQQGSSSIRITFDEIRGGDGRILKRNRWD